MVAPRIALRSTVLLALFLAGACLAGEPTDPNKAKLQSTPQVLATSKSALACPAGSHRDVACTEKAGAEKATDACPCVADAPAPATVPAKDVEGIAPAGTLGDTGSGLPTPAPPPRKD